MFLKERSNIKSRLPMLLELSLLVYFFDLLALTHSRASFFELSVPSSCRSWTEFKVSPSFGPGAHPNSMRSLPVNKGAGIIGSLANSTIFSLRKS